MGTRTVTADRPEVFAAVKAQINAPIGSGYIGKRFFPGVTVRDSAGTFYHKAIDADASAVTDRVNTATIARATVSNGTTAYTAAEAIKAYQIPEGDVKRYGSIDAADRIGITAACRSVYRAHEAACGVKIITSARYNDGTYLTDGQVLKGLQTVALSVGRYHGRTVLAGSTTFFQNFVAASDVSAKIAALIGNAGITLDMLQMSLSNDPKLAVTMLRTFLPFDEVLVGNDDFWALSGKTDAGIVARIPSIEEASDPVGFDLIMREAPVYGATAWYYPDGNEEGEFSARSYFDEDNDNNVYKAKGHYGLAEMNAGAVKIVKLNVFATTTTSTTTTTTAGTTTTTTAGTTTTTTTSG